MDDENKTVQNNGKLSENRKVENGRGHTTATLRRKTYCDNQQGADVTSDVTDTSGVDTHQQLGEEGDKTNSGYCGKPSDSRKFHSEEETAWDILVKPGDGRAWDRMVRLLCRPTDPALLGLCRVVFGLLMVIDTMDERGMAIADIRWGDPVECRFPLINSLRPLNIQGMYLVYVLLLLAACGIMLGLAYRLCCPVYLCCYWYIFLLDKVSWNNHSYLFGIFALFFTITDANRYWSVDALIQPSIRNAHVPNWNYILFRAQIFLVYFIAGLKKLDLDWIRGYSMMNLSYHWVFTPFRLFLTPSQIDVFIVHMGGLFIDLFVGFLLLHEKSRSLGLLISSAFHLMNSQMFSIGMFPYGMLGMQLIFCNQSMPRKLFSRIPEVFRLSTRESNVSNSEECQPSRHCVYSKELVKSCTSGRSFLSADEMPPTKPNNRHKLVAAFTVAFIAWQCFLPYSHSITQGYNTWTNGMYGYSWDMMVHSWEVQHIRVTYKDKDTNQSGYLDPMIWSRGSKRWSGHADMIKQYAHCIENNLKAYNINSVELYFDIWRSLNQRFQQRIVDPRVDVLQAEWNPFKSPSWLMPLIVNKTEWRQYMADFGQSMNTNRTETNFTTNVFVADFPGMNLENYVHSDFGNTSLQVLEGRVMVERIDIEKNFTLHVGDKIQIPSDMFHKVHTVSSIPSSYVYTFVNTTEIEFMERLAEVESHLLRSGGGNKSLAVNMTLEKYSLDPYLPHIKNFLLTESNSSQDKDGDGFSFQRLKSFLWSKYLRYRRSLRLGYGSIYCLVTNTSFFDFLNTTYIRETPKHA